MSSNTTSSLKRSRSSTPSLGTRPLTPTAATEKDTSGAPDLITGEPHIKKELEHWENVVFSFGMDDNSGHDNDGDDSAHSHYLHHLSRGRSLETAHHDAPVIPTASPWDMPSFFSAPAYAQHPPYDVLALGAISPIPELVAPHPHTSPNPHNMINPFGHPPWDLGFYPEVQPPSSQHQIQPLTAAEVAQYHALMARGAASFPLPAPSGHPSAPIPGASSSAPASASISQADRSFRGRSASSAGRSSSQSQPPSVPTSPVDDESSAVITEDKRRRNTAASARFRVKKKQRTAELERTLTELEGRAGELEKEAVELRKENGWLKEMVILKGRKAVEMASANASSSSASQRDKPESDAQEKEGHQGDNEKNKSKD